MGDSAQEKLTPDSQKSGLDQAKESVTGAYDKAAGAVQPGKSSYSYPLGLEVLRVEHLRYHPLYTISLMYLTNFCRYLEGDKSISQKGSDAVSGSNTDNAENTGKSYLQTAQDTVTDTANKVSDTLSGTSPIYDLLCFPLPITDRFFFSSRSRG